MSARASYERMLTSRYRRFGADASFTHPTTGQPATLRMVDLTKAVNTGEDFAQVPTVAPLASARAGDLTALTLDPSDLVGVTLSMSGRNFTVSSFAPHPGMFDASLDQFYFTLEEPLA